MFSNFFRIAIRNLLRQKGYTLINIIGLSVGIASAMLIFMFVTNEENYDTFHEKGKNIYRVYQKARFNGEPTRSAWTPAPMAATLKADYPEIENVVRLDENTDKLVTLGDKYYILPQAVYADSGFFSIFSFRLLQGNPHTALAEPYSVVLTASTAKKIFGSESAMDKLIRVENDSAAYKITGIVQDPPRNSHFAFDILISFSSRSDSKSDFWLNNFLNTYVLLRNGTSAENLEKKFPDMIVKYIGPQIQKVVGLSLEEFAKKGMEIGYKLQPLTDIHLNTDVKHGMKPSSNRKYLYIFSIIGFFIILIASINFMNLSTARSYRRAREVGMRKVLGSDRSKLIIQFLSESILISIVSLVLAFGLLELLLPVINRRIGLELGLDIFKVWQLVLIWVLFAISVGVLAGFYPAFMLSSFHPTAIFKDHGKSGSRGSILRSILVSVQFFMAIVILTGTIVVYQQLRYMQNKDLGFDKERVITIERAGVLNEKMQAFIAELKKYPEIVDATNSTSVPGFPNSDNSFMIEGRSLNDTYVMYTTWTDFNFLNTYKLKMAAGRFFSPDIPSDSACAVINEAALRKMELPNPIGTRIMKPTYTGTYDYLPIIGVLKDFHFQSLHRKIEPYILLIKPRNFDWGGIVSIRIGKGDMNKAIREIENTWKQFTNNQPFEYKFLDDRLNDLYKEERRTSYLAITFTILAIMIACLGLLGLISYSTNQRTKEIAVRKIMGAKTPAIVSLLSSEIFRLIIISSVAAWPAAYFFLKNWLDDFAFRIHLSPFVFIATTLIVLGISLAAIGYQSIWAATRNPADSLRYE